MKTIAAAVEAGEIRNAVLQEAKSVLSNAVSEAWSRSVADRHFSGEVWRNGSMSEELQDLYYKVNVYGLHDVHAAAKRVAATKVEGPAVDAMRAVLQELLPLAQAVTGLKDKIVKGRAPTPPRAPANPDQLRMSCGCCQRPIAVMGGEPTGRMAHHGYTRPGHGWQTASCPGTKFMPLETTDDGPRYMLSMRVDQLRREEAVLARCPELTELSVLVREKGVKRLKKITRDMPGWKKVYDAHVWDIERDIAGLKREIPRLKKIIDSWRPETEAATAVLTQRHGAIPDKYRPADANAAAERVADDAAGSGEEAPEDAGEEDQQPERISG
ncbi:MULTISPECIES: hypothetical protein [unclassified Variovorax]|uniref:hypothetical protein n=1 Tax=unclassified Variovorax TaxID=663243 RepID=UPI0011AFA247|nr:MULTISPECIES: hypothetical protein [unclassified Variovorax]